MADAKTTIELIFEGVDKTGAATQAALSNVDKFAGSVQDATQPFADFTTGAIKLEAGLLLAGAAVTGFSIKVASDFQSAVIDLQKVLSDTDDIEQYTDLAVELGEKYGVASKEVLASIATYKQAGFTANEAAQLTKSGLDAVIAGNVEAARSSDLLVASLKGFGAEASEAAVLVDLLNAVSNNYAANFGQLLEGFAEFSPVARQAGLSLQETVAILTPGIEVFQSGSEVANALGTAFQQLVNDTSDVQESLARLGVSQTDANGDFRSARDIYFDVAKALQGVDENQKLYIASQLVGINRSKQFLAVTAGLDKTLLIASDSFDFLGSAAKEVALQLGSAENATNRAKVAFTNLFIVTGTPLLDEFSGIADAVTAIFQAIGEGASAGGLQEVVRFIETEMQGLQLTLEQVAANLPEALESADFSGFIEGVKAISGAFDSLFDGIDLSTVDGLVKAIELAGFGFRALSEFTAGAVESFKPLFDVLGDVIEEVQKISPETIRSFGAFGGAATQVNFLTTAVGGVISPLNALLAVIGINQAAGLLGALSFIPTASKFAIGALGAAGLAGAAGTAGIALGTLANVVSEKLTGQSISTWALDAAIDLGILSDKTGDVIDSLNDVEIADGDAVAQDIKALDDAMSKFGTQTDASTRLVYNFSTGLFEIEPAVGTIVDLVSASEGAAKGLENSAAAATKLAEAADAIDLKEKLALIEAQSAVFVARIEADAKKTVAAFESINVGIESTGKAITELYGLLGDENIRKFDKLDIRDQIAREEERRESEFDLQKRLTLAQIAEARARIEALRRGGSLITVNGDGLAPHLEAIMFELLEAIQVRVNAEGYSLLLGA